jgi:hypothetical protein
MTDLLNDVKHNIQYEDDRLEIECSEINTESKMMIKNKIKNQNERSSFEQEINYEEISEENNKNKSGKIDNDIESVQSKNSDVECACALKQISNNNQEILNLMKSYGLKFNYFVYAGMDKNQSDLLNLSLFFNLVLSHLNENKITFKNKRHIYYYYYKLFLFVFKIAIFVLVIILHKNLKTGKMKENIIDINRFTKILILKGNIRVVIINLKQSYNYDLQFKSVNVKFVDKTNPLRILNSYLSRSQLFLFLKKINICLFNFVLTKLLLIKKIVKFLFVWLF